ATTYHRADVTDPGGLKELLVDAGDRPILYFALPPAVTARACEALTGIHVPTDTILALEKPFGSDEASARHLNETLTRIVPENQVFRIDHFLGRSTILNLLGARFANRMLEPVWSAEHVESVVIRYDEILGLEGRARYYD